MNILISGISGFIGFSLAKNILKSENDIRIYGLDNLNKYYTPKLKKKRTEILKKYENFEFYKIDIANVSKLKKFIAQKKINLVIHLAAQAGIRYSLTNPREYIKSNQVGFFNILEICKKHKIRLIYASSSSVYGDNYKYPNKEHHPLKPKNIYAATKLGNEIFAEIYSSLHKIEIVGLRFFTVFGEWGRPDMFILKYLETAINKKKFVYYNQGNYFRDFTYIDDLINLIKPLIFLKKGTFTKHEIFNVCSNRPVKINNVYKNLFKLHPHSKIIHARKNNLDVTKTHGSNSKLLRFSKNFKFTNFDEALLKTYNWFIKNQSLFK